MLDRELARKLDPRAAAPQRRLQIVKALSEAGIPVGVIVAPIIPQLNDHDLEAILEAAAAAGARHAGWIDAAAAARGRAALSRLARRALPAARGARDEPRPADARRQGLRIAIRRAHGRPRRVRRSRPTSASSWPASDSASTRIATRRSTRRASGRRGERRAARAVLPLLRRGLLRASQRVHHSAARPDRGRRIRQATFGRKHERNQPCRGLGRRGRPVLLGAGWYTLLGRAWMAGIGKTMYQLMKENRSLAAALHRGSLATGLVIATRSRGSLPEVGAASAAGGANTGAPLALALDRHDARAQLRIRGAAAVAVAHQRRLHVRGHGRHGGHRRPLEAGNVTRPAVGDVTPPSRRSGKPSMPDLTQRLAACYTGAVHDVLRMMGHDNIVLPPEIKAIAPGTRLAGPVWTVVGAHRPHEDAARNAARLVHAAAPGRRRDTSSSASPTTTRSR